MLSQIEKTPDTLCWGTNVIHPLGWQQTELDTEG